LVILPCQRREAASVGGLVFMAVPADAIQIDGIVGGRQRTMACASANADDEQCRPEIGSVASP
jgi:hypothetical protein